MPIRPHVSGVEYEVLGGPGDDGGGGPRLRLDHERFAYAGKFVTGRTGKAVAREDGVVLAAAAFDRDRTDPSVARIRYVTVRDDRRGEGVGPKLLAFLAGRLVEDGGRGPPGEAGVGILGGTRRVLIAVNNAFAFEAAYKAGFCYTGERTGLEELVLSFPCDERDRSYRLGISVLGQRDRVTEAERVFLDDRRSADPPRTIQTPGGA